MKNIAAFFALLFCISARAADTVYVKGRQIPILIERKDNVLLQMRLDAQCNEMLDEVTVAFGKEVLLSEIKSVKLYYSGTGAFKDRGKNRFAPVEYISRNRPGKTLGANSSYSVKKSECRPERHCVTLKAGQPLFPGYNFFWIVWGRLKGGWRSACAMQGMTALKHFAYRDWRLPIAGLFWAYMTFVITVRRICRSVLMWA